MQTPRPSTQLSTLLTVIACAFYLASWASLIHRLANTQETGKATLPGPALAVAAVAFFAHGALVYSGVVTERGFDLGFFNVASITAWVAVLGLLGVTLRQPVGVLGLFVLPIAAFAVLLTALFDTERLVSSHLGTGVKTHIVTSILAYSLLTLATFQAALLYFQEHRLRSRRPGRITRILPPLLTQENLLVQMLGLGFFLLSLSLASGFVFVHDLFAQHLVHKTVLSCIAWLGFATVLYGRWRHGWRGRTLVRWTLAGFVFLMLAYFGAKLVLEVVLDRAWGGVSTVAQPGAPSSLSNAAQGQADGCATAPSPAAKPSTATTRRLTRPAPRIFNESYSANERCLAKFL
ncbi:MAG: ABC-type uncharacterized transport system permease subunit [Gammaproteobacteria bacterium]